MCYLGVVGTQTSLQVNKILACARIGFVFLSLSPLLHSVFSLSLSVSLSLPIPLLFSTFHSLSFSLSSDSLPLSVCLWPSSSHAWEKLTVVSPENLSESAERGGWRVSNSAHLLRSRHFGFPYSERIRLALFYIFLNQKQQFVHLSSFSLKQLLLIPIIITIYQITGVTFLESFSSLFNCLAVT